MLSVIMLSIVVLNVVMLSVALLSVGMLNVIRLNVVAPTLKLNTLFHNKGLNALALLLNLIFGQSPFKTFRLETTFKTFISLSFSLSFSSKETFLQSVCLYPTA
jgi:hypothetical protein